MTFVLRLALSLCFESCASDFLRVFNKTYSKSIIAFTELVLLYFDITVMPLSAGLTGLRRWLS